MPPTAPAPPPPPSGARAPDGDDASLLRDENARLKRLLAEALLELDRLRNP